MTAGEWSSMKFSPHPWDYSACTATMHCAMSGLSGMRKIWSRSLGVPGSRLHWWRSFQGRPGIGGSQVIHPKDVKNLYGMAMMVWEGTKQTPGSWICSSWFTMFDLFASSLHAAHNVMDQGASTSWMTLSRYPDLQDVGFPGTSGTQFQPEMAMVLKPRRV